VLTSGERACGSKVEKLTRTSFDCKHGISHEAPSTEATDALCVAVLLTPSTTGPPHMCTVVTAMFEGYRCSSIKLQPPRGSLPHQWRSDPLYAAYPRVFGALVQRGAFNPRGYVTSLRYCNLCVPRHGESMGGIEPPKDPRLVGVLPPQRLVRD
jgi:hypothetical protein